MKLFYHPCRKNSPLKRGSVFILLGLMGVTLSGCGRYGPPVPPGPDDKVVYPAPYPAE